jgi:hypothetical protein
MCFISIALFVLGVESWYNLADMSAEKHPVERLGEHKLAAGAAIGSLAAAGAAGYLLYRKQRLDRARQLDERRAPDYEKSLVLFDEPRLEEVKRSRMATIAVHIFYASELGGDPIIGREALLDHLASDHGLELSTHAFDDLAGYLKQYKLIGRKHRPQNPRSHGYTMLPALEWGLKFGETPHPLLEEAEAEFWQVDLSDNS